jgi:Ca-activated chloride channel family protein
MAVLGAGVLCVTLTAVQDRAVQQSIPSIRVDVDLVLVNVTVTDTRNRFVGGLSKEHFRIWEDKVEQDIQYFSNEDTPVSLGVVFDESGSMGGRSPSSLTPQQRTRIQETKLQAFNCLKDSLREDEFFLIEFSSQPQVTADFTDDPARLKEKIFFAGAGGRTALWDAVYLGVAKVQEGQYPRKALLVTSDGDDNNSRYTLGQLKTILREQDVRIYTTAANATLDGLNSLSTLTGGAVLRSSNTCEELKAELRNQYVIGYRPTNRSKDGEFRRITVRINADRLPKGFPGLSVRARQGYYATP